MAAEGRWTRVRGQQLVELWAAEARAQGKEVRVALRRAGLVLRSLPGLLVRDGESFQLRVELDSHSHC